MNKYVMELIGTFFLVLTIGMVVLDPGAGNLAPLAIGSILAVMIYAGGHISGAHYNPAVTLAVFIRGKCDAKDVAPYMVAQIIGATIAAFIVLFLKGSPEVTAGTPAVLPALVAEFIFTFALCFVVLSTATSETTAGNSYFGFAIGFTVLAGAYAVGPISGGVFNPAVAIGVTLMGLSALANIWIFLAANLLAGIAAGCVFKAIKPQGA